MKWRYGRYTRLQIWPTIHGCGAGDSTAFRMPPKWNRTAADAATRQRRGGRPVMPAPASAAEPRTPESRRIESHEAGKPTVPSQPAAAAGSQADARLPRHRDGGPGDDQAQRGEPEPGDDDRLGVDQAEEGREAHQPDADRADGQDVPGGDGGFAADEVVVGRGRVVGHGSSWGRSGRTAAGESPRRPTRSAGGALAAGRIVIAARGRSNRVQVGMTRWAAAF